MTFKELSKLENIPKSAAYEKEKKGKPQDNFKVQLTQTARQFAAQ